MPPFFCCFILLSRVGKTWNHFPYFLRGRLNLCVKPVTLTTKEKTSVKQGSLWNFLCLNFVEIVKIWLEQKQKMKGFAWQVRILTGDIGSKTHSPACCFYWYWSILSIVDQLHLVWQREGLTVNCPVLWSVDIGGWLSTGTEEGTELKPENWMPELGSCWTDWRQPPSAVSWTKVSSSIPVECWWNDADQIQVVLGIYIFDAFFREAAVEARTTVLGSSLCKTNICHISSSGFNSEKDVNCYSDLLQCCFSITSQVEQAGSRSC